MIEHMKSILNFFINDEVDIGRRKFLVDSVRATMSIGISFFIPASIIGNFNVKRIEETINDGEWHMVAITRDSTKTNLYIDGELEKSLKEGNEQISAFSCHMKVNDIVKV